MWLCKSGWLVGWLAGWLVGCLVGTERHHFFHGFNLWLFDFLSLPPFVFSPFSHCVWFWFCFAFVWHFSAVAVYSLHAVSGVSHFFEWFLSLKKRQKSFSRTWPSVLNAVCSCWKCFMVQKLFFWSFALLGSLSGLLLYVFLRVVRVCVVAVVFVSGTFFSFFVVLARLIKHTHTHTHTPALTVQLCLFCSGALIAVYQILFLSSNMCPSCFRPGCV